MSLLHSGGSALALLLTFATAAGAQQDDYVGQWACQTSGETYDRTGNRMAGNNDQYMIALYPNATFQAQGASFDGAEFYSEGRWQAIDGGVHADGPRIVTNGINIPGTIFVLLARPQGPNVLILDSETPDPTQTYVAARNTVYCERRG